MLVALVIHSNLTAQMGSFSSIYMTGGSGTSNIRPRIALNKSFYPVVTWNKTTIKSVSYSTWNGSAFSAPMPLSPTGLQADVFTWAGQEIASIQDTLYIVYASLIGSESNVFIHQSTDGGATFSDTLRVSNIGTDKARFPTVGINGSGQPVVLFMRMMSNWAMPRYVVSRSTNSGLSYLPDVDASNSLTGNEVCDCCPANFVSKNNTDAVLFRDNDVNKRDIQAVFSYNGGVSYDSITPVDFNNWMINACPSTGPDGHFGSDSLYTVFASQASSPMKVYMSVTHPTSLQVGTHRIISSSTEFQEYPRIAGNVDTIGIVWEQNNKVMLAYSTNGAAGLSSAIQVNEISDMASAPDIAYANGVFHIVWQSNSGMVHYRTYNLNTASGMNTFHFNEAAIAPNPASSAWTIKLAEQINPVQIELMDLQGRVVYTQDLPAFEPIQHTISNTNFMTGQYFLRIQSGEKSGLYKLVKSEK